MYIDPKLNISKVIGKYKIVVIGNDIKVFNLDHKNYNGKSVKIEGNNVVAYVLKNEIVRIELTENWPDDLTDMLVAYGIPREDLDQIYEYLFFCVFLTAADVEAAQHWN